MKTLSSILLYRLFVYGLASGLMALYATGGYARDVSPEKQPAVTPIKTGKARLSNKANDNQRVDNCKVPLALLGNKQRPEGCKHHTDVSVNPADSAK